MVWLFSSPSPADLGFSVCFIGLFFGFFHGFLWFFWWGDCVFFLFVCLVWFFSLFGDFFSFLGFFGVFLWGFLFVFLRFFFSTYKALQNHTCTKWSRTKGGEGGFATLLEAH